MKEGNTNGTTTIISTIDTLCQGLNLQADCNCDNGHDGKQQQIKN